MVALCGGLTLLVFTACCINTYSAPITCDARIYSVGQPASITCNFRTNISASQQSFNMARYPSTAKQGEIGTDVLVCHWSDANHNHDCSVTYGYEFDNVITDQVTVTIPEAKKAYEGLYMCFFVPSQGKDTHACDFEITLKSMVDVNAVNDNQTALPPNGDNTSNPMWIAGIGVLAVAAIIASVVVYILHMQCEKKKHAQKATGSEIPLIAPKDVQIQKLLESFELHKRNLEPSVEKKLKPKEHLMDILDEELKQGLDNVTRSDEDSTTRSDEDNITRSKADDVTPPKAALQMYRTCCPLLNPSSDADFLVVDWSCDCCKISYVKQRSHGAFITSTSCKIPPEMKTGRGNKIFDLIAESINTFVCDHEKLAGETSNAVLIWPFPCHQTSLKKARLAKWTREFCCEDVVDKDIQELLQSALQKKQTPCKVNIKAIVNDVVSTLVSVAYKTPECKIALTVGSGFNACFVESWAHEGTSITNDGLQEQVIYNTELGALGDNGCLTKFRTDFDRELDDSSNIPGSQIFEKMVSWTYIGDIVRLALRRLRQDHLLLPSEKLGCTLFQKGYITSDRVAQIHSDTESPHQKSKDILTELEVTQCTEEDLKTIRYVCGLVCNRAIYLTSAALATLINRLNQPGVMVVVHGELNKKFPSFDEILYSTTNQLVKPELKDKFVLVYSTGHRNIAAALIADASMRQV